MGNHAKQGCMREIHCSVLRKVTRLHCGGTGETVHLLANLLGWWPLLAVVWYEMIACGTAEKTGRWADDARCGVEQEESMGLLLLRSSSWGEWQVHALPCMPRITWALVLPAKVRGWPREVVKQFTLCFSCRFYNCRLYDFFWKLNTEFFVFNDCKLYAGNCYYYLFLLLEHGLYAYVNTVVE